VLQLQEPDGNHGLGNEIGVHENGNESGGCGNGNGYGYYGHLCYGYGNGGY